MSPQPVNRNKQQLGGLAMALLGAALTGWTWYTATTKGYYYRKASILFPAFLVLGLGLVLFPDYKAERLARGEDLGGLSGAQLVTPRWWAVVGLAVAAGLINAWLLPS